MVASIKEMNPEAIIADWDELDTEILQSLKPSLNSGTKMDHHKSHWSSCSVDLPDPMNSEKLKNLLEKIPDSVLRVKGCTKLDEENDYTFFERTPTGETFFRPFLGKLVSGPKLLLIGPGSDPKSVESLLN